MPSSDPRHRQGRAAEAWLSEQLQAGGWTILARNLRTPYAEVDLLARPPQEAVLVLVEVKARSPLRWGTPLEAVSRRQRARLARAAEYLALRQPGIAAVRVDLALVECWDGRPGSWEHWPDLLSA